MSLEHRERLQWCEEVSKINKKQNEDESRRITEI
jgi:hypothetical protein